MTTTTPHENGAAGAKAQTNGHGTTGAAAGIERLFLRCWPQAPADAPPRALPRGEDGQPKRRPEIDDHPLPASEELRATYEPAFARMERLLPLRVAVLRDHLGRTLAGLERYRRVRAEEVERQQLFNEDARHAERVIDAKVAELTGVREAAEKAHDAAIEAALDARARAREVAVVAQAAAGGNAAALWSSFQDEDGGENDVAAPPATAASETTEVDAAAAAAAAVGADAETAAESAASSAGTAAAAVAAEATPADAVPPDAPDDTRPPTPRVAAFDPAYGEERARPAGAIALEQGLVYGSAADHALGGTWERLLEWPALAVCGGIFGVSVGFLTDLLDPSLILRRFDAAWPMLLAMCALGCFLFWLLGRVVTGLAALASEEFHGALAATRRDAPDRVGAWLLRSGLVALALLVVAVVALVVIEGNVERHGVMGALLERRANQAIAAGGGPAASESAGPSPVAVWCIVLIVSLPFVLLHAARGWVEARARTLTAYVDARRADEAWRLSDGSFRRHQEEVDALHAEELALWRSRRDTAAAAATRALTARDGGDTRPPAPPVEPHAIIAEQIERIARGRDHDTPGVAVEMPRTAATPPADAVRFDGDGNALLRPGSVEALRDAAEAVALAVTRAREAQFRVRVAYARRRDEIARIERDIVRWESLRAAERHELESESVRRIEDAHTAYVLASRSFDRLFREEMERYERVARPGLFRRLVRSLVGPGIETNG